MKFLTATILCAFLFSPHAQGKENSTLLSQLIGKMPQTNDMEKTLVYVDYWIDGNLAETTPGVFISETIIIAHAKVAEKSGSDKNTPGTISVPCINVRRRYDDDVLIPTAVNIANSIAKLTVMESDKNLYAISYPVKEAKKHDFNLLVGLSKQGIGDLIFIEYKFYGIGMRMNGNMVVFQYCVE